MTNAQVVGLKSVHAGNPLPKGVKDENAADLIAAFTKIKQPYDGGITFNFTTPTSNKWYREGEAEAFQSMRDPTTGSKEVSWSVVDFDDDTLEFYFGTTEPVEGKLYEGEKAFAFDSNTGATMVAARVKFTAALTGSMNDSDPLQIAVSGDILAPAEGGVAWWPIPTPTYTADNVQQ